MIRKLMRFSPRIQRFHFALLLVVVGCMFFLETFYISLKYGKTLSYFFDYDLACSKFQCTTGHISYYVRSGKEGKESIVCYDGEELVKDFANNVVHVAYISSNTMVSRGSEKFDIKPDSMLHLNLPLNTIFFIVTGNITHKSYLDKFMLINFNVTLPTWETSVAMVGWLEDTGRVYIHHMADNSTDSQIKGCLKMFSGLTTCGNLKWCPRGSVNFYVRGSSYKNSISSGICYNNTFVIRPGLNLRKGMNALVINDKNLTVEELRTFDTHEEGETFDEYLRNLTGNKILILANEFEATKSLRNSTRELLGDFGSTLIRLFDKKDSIIMVGQRGLYVGSALEKLQKRYVQGYPIVSGCLTTRGIGMLRNLPPSPKIDYEDGETSGLANTTCASPSSCPDDSFPVSLFSGEKNEIPPRMCVDGKSINATLLGRGINVAVFNTKSRSVKKFAVFDTFGSSETNIAGNLNDVGPDDVVIAMTHDDGSARITSSDKAAFKKLGSYYIDQLNHRNSWYLIGRLNLDGYTPYEEIKFSFYKGVNTWSSPIEVKTCIPFKFYGAMRPGVGPTNVERREYCRMQAARVTGERDDLCSALYSWQPLQPIMLQNPGVSKNPVFGTPIFVLIGSDKTIAMSQLSSVFSMEGLNPDNVFVLHDNSTTDHSQLIKIFKFNEIVIAANSTLDVLTSAFGSSENRQRSDDVIVFEEGVLATKHYLVFLANLYAAYSADPSICCVSAYNHHGYIGVSSFQKDLVYVVDDGPSRSYLIKSSFVNQISSMGAFPKAISTLQPDVSRVVQHPLSPDFYPPYPSSVRSYARGQEVLPTNVTHLTELAYQKILKNLLIGSVKVSIDDSSCQFAFNQSNSSNVASVFKQERPGSFSGLAKMLQCFRIPAKKEGHLVKGTYKGVFRFTNSASTSVFLVGSLSPYAKYLLPDAGPGDK